MSSLADFIFEHSGSLKVSVAFPSGVAAKVQMSDGIGVGRRRALLGHQHGEERRIHR